MLDGVRGMPSLGRAQPPWSTPRRRRERREEGLAEDRPALQAVAPVLADRRAALPALAAGRGLVRLDDDELRILQLVPPRIADEEEREVVGPRLEFEERELPADEEVVDALQEIPGVFEPDDLLLLRQDELDLPQVQFLVQPRGILRGERQLERTESRVNFLQDRIELERLRHAEAEPVREDAGHGLVRRAAVLRDERRLAARVDGHALREHGLRWCDGETEVDEPGVRLADEHLDLARFRRRGRRRGLLLRLLYDRLRVLGLLDRPRLYRRFLFRLRLRLLRFPLGLAPPVSTAMGSGGSCTRCPAGPRGTESRRRRARGAS